MSVSRDNFPSFSEEPSRTRAGSEAQRGRPRYGRMIYNVCQDLISPARSPPKCEGSSPGKSPLKGPGQSEPCARQSASLASWREELLLLGAARPKSPPQQRPSSNSKTESGKLGRLKRRCVQHPTPNLSICTPILMYQK